MSESLERRGFLKNAIAALAGTAILSSLFPRSALSQSPSPAGPASITGYDPYIGEIMLIPYNFAPTGWAFCNGQLLLIGQNQALFALLGTNFGGDGITTFALPDLRGRVPIHMGQGAGMTNRNLGEKGGEETHLLITSEIPSHTHVAQGSSAVGSSDDPTNALPAKNAAGIPQYGTGTPATLNPSAIQNSGGGGAHNNMPPYLTLNYVIALQGVFPSHS